MQLKLVRQNFLPLCTIGELTLNGEHICYTLEDTQREVEGQPVESWKIPKKTAIPKGTYEIVITYSNRFKRFLPELLNVPGYTGVRIHAGNTQEDTEGCILVGLGKAVTYITSSRLALKVVQPLIQSALDKNEKVFIEITDGN